MQELEGKVAIVTGATASIGEYIARGLHAAGARVMITGIEDAKGEAVAVVESVKAAFDVYAPISGEVSEVNAELTQNPALVNQSPHDKGWFFRVKPADVKETDSLMDYAQYQDFLKTAVH